MKKHHNKETVSLTNCNLNGISDELWNDVRNSIQGQLSDLLIEFSLNNRSDLADFMKRNVQVSGFAYLKPYQRYSELITKSGHLIWSELFRLLAPSLKYSPGIDTNLKKVFELLLPKPQNFPRPAEVKPNRFPGIHEQGMREINRAHKKAIVLANGEISSKVRELEIIHKKASKKWWGVSVATIMGVAAFFTAIEKIYGSISKAITWVLTW